MDKTKFWDAVLVFILVVVLAVLKLVYQIKVALVG